MDWLTLQSSMPKDSDLPARSFKISALNRVLDGTLYDHINTSFDDEIGMNGEYIPFSNRRPSVKSGICRTVVDDSVSLLFSESHWPTFKANDRITADVMTELSKARRLNELFIDAATRGSVGSIAILMKILKQKPFFSVLTTTYLTPVYDENEPDVIVSVIEKYKVSARDLINQGYQNIDPQAGMYWFLRVFDTNAENWYNPWPVAKTETIPTIDINKSIVHGLGFCPILWIKNLPCGDEIDGGCTFENAISTSIEMDYSLSQTGRGLKYAGDPRLVIRDASGSNKPIVGGASNAILFTDPQSDAKFLEINGNAAAAVLEYVKFLRGIALEATHGMRADADKLSAATSGRALEILHQSLIWLSDKLRTSYGEGGLLKLLKMVCAASCVVKSGIIINGKTYKNLNHEGLILVWSRWFASTSDDRESDARTSATLVESGIMSKQTVLRNIATDYDVENIQEEQNTVTTEVAAEDARAVALAATVKATTVLPA